MTQTRYVKTDEIKVAVRGHEVEILAALAIPWTGRSAKIECPYPDHADSNPSWRWDEVKCKAFCTCKCGDTIFNVAMKMKAIDFEAAKLLAAEAIGRNDLIQTSTGRKNPRRNESTPECLLNPSPENRDDSLFRQYLGSRLEIDPKDVPMPSTKVVGLKLHAYYDPPAPTGGRARLVGKYPTLVFATVSPDGRTHAHRIYVAEVPKLDDGTKRDLKKSATGSNTSGCAVLWGDYATAVLVIVAEGIETACAIAFAFRTEIEAGTYLVAAAISTNGVATFRPWPAAKVVIVAADRDEQRKSDER